MDAKFSAPVQIGPGTQLYFFTMGTGSFPGLKGPGLGVDHPTHLERRSKVGIELNLCSSSGSSVLVLV